jgi:hypothetical protein
MELIPLVTIKKRKIYTGSTTDTLLEADLIDQIKSDIPVYFFDTDGINNDKPNLCTYQRIGTKLQIWADSGPRVLGDIVDTVMAGAQRITIRPSIWTLDTIEHIHEITEQQLYLHLENSTISQETPIDGIVLLENQDHPQNNFKLESQLKTLATKTKIYVYDPDKNNYSYWQKHGITGILIPLDHYTEYLTNVR